MALLHVERPGRANHIHLHLALLQPLLRLSRQIFRSWVRQQLHLHWMQLDLHWMQLDLHWMQLDSVQLKGALGAWASLECMLVIYKIYPRFQGSGTCKAASSGVDQV